MSTNTEKMVDDEIRNMTGLYGIRRSSTRASQLIEEEMARLQYEDSQKAIKEAHETSSSDSEASNQDK